MTLLVVVIVLGVLVALGMFGLSLLKGSARREAAWQDMADREAVG